MKFIVKRLLASKSVANTGWLVAEKIISMFFVLVGNIFIARLLGPNEYGLLSLLLSILGVLVPLTTLGLGGVVVKELVNKDVSTEVILSTSVVMRLIAGLIVLLIVIVLLEFGVFNNISGYEWGLILLSIVNIVTAFHVVDFWFQSLILSKYVVLVRLSVIISMFAVKMWLVLDSASLQSFIIAAAVESILLSSGYYLIYWYKEGRLKLRYADANYGVGLLKQSKWLILSGVASVLNLKVDQVMLGSMSSLESVGIYSVASKLSEVWYFFPIAIASSYFPVLIKNKNNNSKAYMVSLQKLCDILFLLAIIVALFTTVFGKYVITGLYGPQYLDSVQILVVHIWAGTFIFMRAVLSKWLILENLLHFSLVSHGIGAVVNVLLNLYMIPLYDGVGAAYASVISYGMASYGFLFFSKKTHSMAYTMSKSMLLIFRVKEFIKYFSVK